MSSLRVLDAPNSVLGWDGHRPYLAEPTVESVPPPANLGGAAAAVQIAADGSARVFRDRLGIGKLFWARDTNGGVSFAARPMQLIRAGHDLDAVMAVPRGLNAEFDRNGHLVQETAAPPLTSSREDDAPPLAETGRRIRREIDSYLAALASAYPRRRAFVCLSGGLDSSTIAVLAREHFAEVTAVSFDLKTGPSWDRSEDRVAAERLAKDLGLKMIEATVSREELLSWLDTVLVEGIDWRDFNVHCALVNAALANVIALDCKDDAQRPLVITGDLSNEFLVDYQQEEHNGVVYYALPRITPARLRSILIQGLDTCHREVGVFEAWGLTVAQPYAVAVDAYLALPPSFLKIEHRKDLLVREMIGDALPDYIYSRPKVRAQTGGVEAGGGVLGACVSAGIDQAMLRSRFARLHGDLQEESLERFIRAGRYRAALPTPEGVKHERD